MGHLQDGIRLDQLGIPDRALPLYMKSCAPTERPEVRSEAYRRIARIHIGRCSWDEALQAAEAAAEVARSIPDPDLEAEALNAQGSVHLATGDDGSAEQTFRAILEITQSPRIRGIAEQNLATVASRAGRFEEAERRQWKSLALFKEAGYKRGEVINLNNFGSLLMDRAQKFGDTDLCELAEFLFERAKEESHVAGDRGLHAIASLNLADALCNLRQDTERAVRLASEASGFFAASRDVWRRASAYSVLAKLFHQKGDLSSARRAAERSLGFAREIDARVEIQQMEEFLQSLSMIAQPVHA